MRIAQIILNIFQKTVSTKFIFSFDYTNLETGLAAKMTNPFDIELDTNYQIARTCLISFINSTAAPTPGILPDRLSSHISEPRKNLPSPLRNDLFFADMWSS